MKLFGFLCAFVGAIVLSHACTAKSHNAVGSLGGFTITWGVLFAVGVVILLARKK